ncbi:MAG TPA: NAD(P)/FAD-dependent oxidoreductase [Stellaceae bacterium]|nr:NAD(P)/FAD-dependent oxidoreductase [Stellaceae bacterium]
MNFDQLFEPAMACSRRWPRCGPKDRCAAPRDAGEHIVIVGGGFGGLAAAVALRRAPVRVTIIDRRNYHLFQPLLYQVATAGLSPADIASPIRSILRRHRNTTVLLGKVTGIDVAGKAVLTDTGRLAYDQLVVATGARHAYFSHEEWERFAPGLKKIDDAVDIRGRILIAFERAESSSDERERRRLLSFVIVGGGPTGVEMAGAIAELARRALATDFRNIDPGSARIVLVESGPRLLSHFPEPLSAFAERSLARLGVEIRVGTRVSRCDPEGVVLANQRLEAHTIVWAAGVMASPAAKWLDAERDAAGRVLVGPDLTLKGHPEIFVIGDTASVDGADGKPLPGIALVAKQQGAYVARVIAARRRGGPAPAPFRYRHLGTMATIGRKSAVVDFGGVRLTGFAAWLLWGLVHVCFLVGFRNRAAVTMGWLWAYLTFERGARLITGHET